MAIDVSTISENQQEKILKMAEGHFGDLKATEIRPAKLSRTVSAFANADGGELYIGVKERSVGGHKIREWQGFSDEEAANGHLQLFEELFPLGQEYSYAFLRVGESRPLVLQVQVRKSQSIVRASNGVPYVRRGAQNLPVTTDKELRQLERNKGITSFETETAGIGLDELTNSETVIGFMLEVIPTAEPEPWLRKQRLIVDDKATVAGILLFHDLPQAALPKRCGVKVYRYTTSEAEGTREALVDDPISIEGATYDLIHEAVAQTQATIDQLQVLGSEGLEAVEYPPEALHEVITNAVLHRDYSIADDVHIRIFDNRVEVESPGRLPAHVTPQNILAERFARNGNVVRVINKFPNPPNKDVGEGLNTAFAAMRKLQLREPIIEERENSVVVHVRHEPLASAEELVIDYLRDHGEINNSTARQITAIDSENQMKRVFYRLRDRDLISQVGGRSRRNAAWELTDKGRKHVGEGTS